MVFMPLLRFQHTNSHQLLAALSDHNTYDGLIFTSANAIESVKTALEQPPHSSSSSQEHSPPTTQPQSSQQVPLVQCRQVLEAWSSKHVFCVGQETQQSALNLFGVERFEKGVQNFDGIGRADSLAQLIVSKKTELSKPLLFLCGNMRRDELPQALQANGVQLKELVVYNTVQSEPLSTSQTQAPSPSSPSSPDGDSLEVWLVFFSPSGVESFMSCIPLTITVTPTLTGTVNHDGNSFQFVGSSSHSPCMCKVVALGPTTANALQSKVGLTPHAVCKSPTPLSLVEALKSS